jgi:hypothetical protein
VGPKLLGPSGTGVRRPRPRPPERSTGSAGRAGRACTCGEGPPARGGLERGKVEVIRVDRFGVPTGRAQSPLAARRATAARTDDTPATMSMINECPLKGGFPPRPRRREGRTEPCGSRPPRGARDPASAQACTKIFRNRGISPPCPWCE